MWSDSEIAQFVAMAARLGVEPRAILAIMAHESGCSPAAHNPGGAVGLIQFEPQTLSDLGWTKGTNAFAVLSVAAQLPFVERYYAARRTSIAAGGSGIPAFYVATFLPAFTAHAGDAAFVLCGKAGPLAWAYAANRVFDVEGKGTITPADMTAAAEKALAGSSKAQFILARIEALAADA